MLTRQGWVVGVGALVLLAGGRVFGLVELTTLGLVAVLLLVGALAVVHLARLDLEIGRTVHPARIHVGALGRVEIALRNRRAGRTPVLRLRDPVSGTRGAELLVPPLDRAERTAAAYRLPTDRRGVLEIGPLEVVVGDPFGLARVSLPGASRVGLTVYPHVDEIAPVPYTTGHDPLSGARQPNSLGRTGEDFYALRPYSVGDDLRRVHWPSSARADELLVRQNELPWQGRTTVLLDTRKVTNSPAGFELAVSAVASVLTATARRNDLVRLVTTAGVDSDFSPGSDHLEAIMEHLAVVPLAGTGSLRRSVELLSRGATGGALVVVLTDASMEDLAATNRLLGRYGSVTIVRFDRSAWDPTAEPTTTDDRVLTITRDAAFAPSWDAYVRLQGRGRRASAAMAAGRR